MQVQRICSYHQGLIQALHLLRHSYPIPETGMHFHPLHICFLKLYPTLPPQQMTCQSELMRSLKMEHSVAPVLLPQGP